MPSTLGEEWRYNPFARLGAREVRGSVGVYVSLAEHFTSELISAASQRAPQSNRPGQVRAAVGCSAEDADGLVAQRLRAAKDAF